jgi:hypothetical protein
LTASGRCVAEVTISTPCAQVEGLAVAYAARGNG